MSVRVTQEAVEVLGLGDGKLRVTQLAVEILADEPELQEVSDSLALSDEASGSLAGGTTFEAEATDTLTLSDSVEGNFIEIFDVTAEDTLTLGEGAGQVFAGTATDTLTLTDECAGLAQGEFDALAQDFLPLREALGQFYFGTPTDTLTLADVIPPTAPDAFVLSDTASGTRIKTALDAFGVTDTLDRRVEFDRAVADSVTALDAATGYVPNPCDVKLNVAPIRNLFKGHVVLTVTGTGTTILLRNPAWGDREELNFSRINRTTRGGTRIQFSEPTWPKYTRFTLDIPSLSQTQVDELKAFLLASLGKEVQLSDWTGRYFLGVITNPDTVISQTGRKRWEYTIIFEGEETTSIYGVSSDTLFTEELDRQVAYGRTVTDTLLFIEEVDDTSINRFRSADDTLTLSDDAASENNTAYIGLLGEGILGWDFMLGEYP